MNFINRFHALGSNYYSELPPSHLPDARLAAFSNSCAHDFGLDALTDRDQLTAVTAGQTLLPGMKPLAAIYSGHQFGSYNPQLGDGRAILLGEIKTDVGAAELQLKGAGATPYSRFADGRAVLRSSIREFLASEAMAALNIPTTRALSIVSSPMPVYREQVEQAACVLRVAPSFVRFGSFEYFHYTNQPDSVKTLADHVISAHLPLAADASNPYLELFRNAILTTADMIAKWQAVGFAHGVMNTDNMSILGLTIDYGPYGFLDDYNPGFICNHSDTSGRYAFDQQPGIALWNLNALGHALSSLIEKQDLIDALAEYEPRLLEQYSTAMRAKLALSRDEADDHKLVSGLLDLMANNHADYTNTFRALCYVETDNSGFIDQFIDRDGAEAWLNTYLTRIDSETTSASARLNLKRANNPKYILRNYLAQNAIAAAEDGDFSELNTLLKVLAKPFDEQTEFDNYAKAPPDWGKHLEISCSS